MVVDFYGRWQFLSMGALPELGNFRGKMTMSCGLAGPRSVTGDVACPGNEDFMLSPIKILDNAPILLFRSTSGAAGVPEQVNLPK